MQAKHAVVLVLAFVFGAGVVLLLESTPKRQADRAVQKCIEVARVMESMNSFQGYLNRDLGKSGAPWDSAPVSSDPAVIYGYTMACLYGRQR